MMVYKWVAKMKHTRNKCLTFDLELEGGEKTCRQFMTVPGRRDRAVSNHQGQYVHPAVKCPNHLFTLSQWLKLPNVCNNRSMIVCVCLYISLSFSLWICRVKLYSVQYIYIFIYTHVHVHHGSQTFQNLGAFYCSICAFMRCIGWAHGGLC